MKAASTSSTLGRNPRKWLLGWIVLSLHISAPFVFVGCIPGFHAFLPVTKQELKPQEKNLPAAEWLWRNWTYYVGAGPQNSSLWRGTFRLRINKPAGLKATLLRLPLSRNEQNAQSPSPLAFSSSRTPRIWGRTTCPGQKKAVYLNRLTLREKKEQVRCWREGSPGSCWLRHYLAQAPQVKTGCIVDVYFDVFANAPVKGSLAFPVHSALPVRKARYRVFFPHGFGMRTSLHHMDMYWRLWARQYRQKHPGEAFQKFLAHKSLPLSREPLDLSFDLKRRQVQLVLRKLPAWDARFTRTLRWQGYDRRRLHKPFWLVQLEPHHPTMTTLQRKSWVTVVDSLLQQLKLEKQAKSLSFPKLARHSPPTNAVLRWFQKHFRYQKKAAPSLQKALQLRRGNLRQRTLLAVLWLRTLGVRAFPVMAAPLNRTWQDTEPQIAALSQWLVYLPGGKWKGTIHERKQRPSADELKSLGIPRTRKGRFLSLHHPALKAGIVPASLAQQWTLVLTEQGGQWAYTPNVPTTAHLWDVALQGQLDPAGKLVGKISWKRRGHGIHTSSELVKRWKFSLLEWLRSVCPLAPKNTLLSLPSATRLAARAKGELALNMVCLAVKKQRSELQLPLAAPRFAKPTTRWKTPLDLGAPLRVHYKLQLRLPKTASLTRCCQMKERVLRGFGVHLSLQDKVENATLYSTSIYEHRQRRIEPKQAKVVRLWLERVARWKTRGSRWNIDWAGK